LTIGGAAGILGLLHERRGDVVPRLAVVCLALALWSLATIGRAPNAAAQSPIPASVRECLRLTDAPFDGGNQEALRKAWLEACKQALQADGNDPRIKVALAHAYAASGERAAAVDLYRAAAGQNDAEAAFQIYDTYKSYDRSDVTKPQLVKRAEAEQSLRKAAELGHPYSMWILAVLLDRGSTVKRDPAGAIHWAERAMAKPPKDTTALDIQVRLGHFLAKGGNPEQRARGIQVLEAAPKGRGDAKAWLALAIRGSDPVRARALLEAAERSYPGHAIPALADMLIKGEGGPKDEKRALSLLQGRRASDVAAVKAALGQLYLEGRLVPRDIPQAVRLIRLEAVWSHEARLQTMGLLAANPEIDIVNPGGFLYDATEAAELDEPGAMAALIDLKLSPNAQFRDQPGGCKLAKEAAARTRAGARHLQECR
jgi:TPR repeat protein